MFLPKALPHFPVPMSSVEHNKAVVADFFRDYWTNAEGKNVSTALGASFGLYLHTPNQAVKG